MEGCEVMTLDRTSFETIDVPVEWFICRRCGGKRMGDGKCQHEGDTLMVPDPERRRQIRKNMRLKRFPEEVRDRHNRLLVLWREGYTLQECAERVGLTDRTGADHHVNGRC